MTRSTGVIIAWACIAVCAVLVIVDVLIAVSTGSLSVGILISAASSILGGVIFLTYRPRP